MAPSKLQSSPDLKHGKITGARSPVNLFFCVCEKPVNQPGKIALLALPTHSVKDEVTFHYIWM